MIIKLALRNLIGAGLRTWLNVFVLSLAFVVIIWMQGFIEGLNRYAMSAKTEAEVGGGHYWHRMYDPYDPLTLEDSHAPLSPVLADLVEAGDAIPILVTTGAIYPEGRVRSVELLQYLRSLPRPPLLTVEVLTPEAALQSVEFIRAHDRTDE